MRSALRALVVALVLAAAMPVALAGNMAITVFDELPEDFEAGTTHPLEYTILQHGQTPVDGANSEVIFTDSDTGQVLTFAAEPTGEPGRYAVEVMIPSEGDWQMQVTQGPFEAHEFGTIAVAPAAAAAASSTGWMDVLRFILPLAAIAAAALTIRAVARSRSGGVEPSSEVG